MRRHYRTFLPPFSAHGKVAPHRSPSQPPNVVLKCWSDARRSPVRAAVTRVTRERFELGRAVSQRTNTSTNTDVRTVGHGDWRHQSECTRGTTQCRHKVITSLHRLATVNAD